ncbi:hypothetical protein ACL1E3_02060 [Corynebacterium striatum]
MRNIKDSSTREFVVPAGGGSLGSLLAASLDYEPVVVTRLQELIDSARDAAERLSGAALSSEEKADSSAKAARRFEDAASKYAAAAKVSQDAAKGSEDVAAQSASAADVSAKAAKASQDAAAGSASSAKQSESNAAAFKNAADSFASDAATSAGNAEKSAGAAKAAQARSEEIATSTSWSGDRLTVNGKTSPSLTGPPGPKGDTGSVENVSWADISDKPDFASTWEQVKGKPDAFPTTWDEVKGKPDAFPTTWDEVKDKPDLNGAIAGVKAFAESRPAFFSGKGEPPATIPGAVVGDYYLNEASMELHRITGV